MVTDEQVRRLMKYIQREKTYGIAAAKAGMDEKKLHSALSKPRKYLQAILEAAGRPKGTLHSFRVTYNNSLRDLGLGIQDRKILLAHSSVSTTEIYTLPNLELARSYVNQLPIPGEKFELNGS